ncbi:MAG: hypothetical protein ACRC3B_13340 [Bacteroidia bacterium]
MSRLFSTANGRRPLAPAFINRIDKWLLLNYPTIWTTRIHLFLWYALIGYALIYITFFILPDDPRSRSYVELRMVITGLLAGLAVILWGIYLLRFNTFKRYGQPNALVPGVQFLLFFLMLCLAGFTIIIPPLAEKHNADAAFSSDELVKDVNDANYLINVLEHENNPVKINADTVLFVKTKAVADSLYRLNQFYSDIEYKRNEAKELLANSDSTSVDPFDTVSFPKSRAVRWEPDSLRKEICSGKDTVTLLGDSGVVLYTWENILYVRHGEAQDNSDVEAMSELDLYTIIYKQKRFISPDKARKEYYRIANKYLTEPFDFSTSHDSDMYYAVHGDIRRDYYTSPSQVISYHYMHDEIENSIHHIEKRKYWFDWNGNLQAVVLSVLYISMILSLLLLAFRHSTLRTFAATVLAGVVLAIINGVVLAFFRASETQVLLLMAAWIIGFLVAAFTIPASRVRSLWKGIALHISLYGIFFLPLLFVGAYYQFLHHHYGYGMYDEYRYLYVNEDLHYEMAQYGGAALLLAALFIIYGRLFRIWYSQPEE